MALTELFVFGMVILVGVLGHMVGQREGYKRGWFDGHQDATMKLLPVSHVNVYDHTKEGL